MNKYLFFLCPTDGGLEAIVNRETGTENYFYYSLANSTVLDDTLVAHLNRLIIKNKITEVVFILSSDNKIVNDVFQNRNYIGLKGVNNFYNKISILTNCLVKTNQEDYVYPFLSNYLNVKVKELEQKLCGLLLTDQIKISARIYNRRQERFQKTFFDTYFEDYFSLN